MQKNTKLRFGVVAAIAAAALAIGAAAPAYADPATPKPLNGSGSDTTQDVMNGIAALVPAIGNWNAVPASSQITIDGTTFNRPIGSTNGVRALSQSLQGLAFQGTVLPVGLLDYARASALRSDSGTQLTYIPFAGDALTIAFNAASDFPRDVALGASGQATNLFTLRNIYLGTRTTFRDKSAELVTIVPILPQTGSGTREYWITTALGTTEAAVAAGLRATDLGNRVQEHDGRFLNGPGDIVPYSVAQWIAQSNATAAGLSASTAAIFRPVVTGVIDRRGQSVLGGIDTRKPVTWTGSTFATNPEFEPVRNVYNIVETRALTTASPSANDTLIRQTFVGPSSTVCQAMASATVAPFGFGQIGSVCGDTTEQRGYVAP